MNETLYPIVKYLLKCTLFFQNFKSSLEELKQGKKYTKLTLQVVPKTDEDAEKIKKKGEKTKEVLFTDLTKEVQGALEKFPDDEYLIITKNFLDSKTYKSFSPKLKLLDLTSQVEEHLTNVVFETELREALGGSTEWGDDIDNDELEVEI